MYTIYTTFASKKEIEMMANLVLEEKLAACVNYFPINSIYFWKNKKIDEKEYTCLFKTNKKNLKNLIKFIEENHSYEIPIIEVLKLDSVNKKYLNWLNKETR